MDFKRIQVLMVIFFLFFDLYLAWMLITRVGLTAPTTTPVEYSVEENLASRSIKYPKLDQNQYEEAIVQTQTNDYLRDNLGQLQNQTADVDENGVLQAEFDEAISLGERPDEETGEFSDDFYQSIYEQLLLRPELFIAGGEYRNMSYTPEEKVIYLRQEATEGHPIVDGTAELRLNLNEDFQITSYRQTYQADVKVLDQTITTISQAEAVRILDHRVDTLIPDRSEITRIRLTYYRSTSLPSVNIYAPTWEVTYIREDGRRRNIYVDASRGTVINNNSLTPSSS
ncbi:two-component system regulatory protein YycI [Hutsoniella sourekii]